MNLIHSVLNYKPKLGMDFELFLKLNVMETTDVHVNDSVICV